MVGNGLFVFVGGCLFVLNCIEIEIMMCVLLGQNGVVFGVVSVVVGVVVVGREVFVVVVMLVVSLVLVWVRNVWCGSGVVGGWLL